MRDVVAVAYILGTLYVWVDIAVTVAAVLRPSIRPIRVVFDQWLWVSFLFMALGDVLLGHQVSAGIQFVCAAVMFWIHRNNDHWKQLRRRVDSVVRDIGHRLAVAPVPIRAE